MTGVINEIKFTPYRGALEPVNEVRKAVINLYPNHIEIIQDYSFKPYLDSSKLPYVKSAYVFPKTLISIELTEQCHSEDKDLVMTPVIYLYIGGNYQEPVYLETLEEAYHIYKDLKNWILNP